MHEGVLDDIQPHVLETKLTDATETGGLRCEVQLICRARCIADLVQELVGTGLSMTEGG